jgi:hypothetical protein
VDQFYAAPVAPYSAAVDSAVAELTLDNLILKEAAEENF